MRPPDSELYKLMPPDATQSIYGRDLRLMLREGSCDHAKGGAQGSGLIGLLTVGKLPGRIASF